MLNEESGSELESKKSNLFESLGGLVGLIATGTPVGAFAGAVGGALLSGKSGEDALQSGVGAFFQGATMGAPGLALNALGGGVVIPETWVKVLWARSVILDSCNLLL